MTAYLTSKRAAFAIAGLLGIFALSGGALAITDSVFKYTNPKTGYYGIDHMAMAPDGTSSANDYGMDWGNGLQAATGNCFNTAVNLPNGATITNVTVWYEGGTDAVLTVQLHRHKFIDGTSELVGTNSLTDTTSTRTSGNVPVAATIAVINNQQYSYGFGICVHSTSFFYAARIRYQYSNAGD
jgi:hypothetical protein